MKFQRFVEELQRRHVLRVAGGYLVASWFAIEVTSTVLPLVGKPEEGAGWVLRAAIAGIPVMLLLAWFFDYTKHGIVRTPPRDLGEDDISAAMDAQQPNSRGRVVLSARATGMFGLGALVAIFSVAAYSQTWNRTAQSQSAAVTSDSAIAAIESLAVLTFTDMSENRDQKYFADGITEELISRLAQIHDLRVVSGRKYAGSRSGDVGAIGDVLDVQAVLEGSVRRSRDSVRVTVNLIAAANDAILFSESFTRPVADVFKVQDEIAAAVAGALRRQRAGLSGAEGTRGTTSELAFDLYTRGRAALSERTDADLRRAITYFEGAIREDPKFALAWASLAQTYAVLPTVGSFDFEKAGTLGTQAAGQAIALDPTLGLASAALGQIMQNLGWDPASAEVQYQRAIEFSPNDATAHQWYAETLTMLGRTDEAMREIKLALESKTPAASNALGYLLTIRGDLDGALNVFRSASALYPEYRLGHLTHALTAMSAGKYAEAERAAAAYAGADMKMAAALSRAIRAAAGTAPHAQGVAAAASLEESMGPSFAALWLAALGDTRGAMTLVQRAYDERQDANFPYFVIHPLLRPLHSEPAYQAIVTAMGVKPAR